MGKACLNLVWMTARTSKQSLRTVESYYLAMREVRGKRADQPDS